MFTTHTKKFSISLAIGELKIKIAMSYNYSPTRKTKIKKIQSTKYWGGCERTELSYIADGNVKYKMAQFL